MDASWIDYRESLVRHAHRIEETSQQQALFFVDMRQNNKIDTMTMHVL